MSVAALSLLAACATDPYTGESKVSKTAWGTGIGAVAGAGIGASASVRPAARLPAVIWIFRPADCVRNWSAPVFRFRK